MAKVKDEQLSSVIGLCLTATLIGSPTPSHRFHLRHASLKRESLAGDVLLVQGRQVDDGDGALLAASFIVFSTVVGEVWVQVANWPSAAAVSGP